jgi:hypothetical protein
VNDMSVQDFDNKVVGDCCRKTKTKSSTIIAR